MPLSRAQVSIVLILLMAGSTDKGPGTATAEFSYPGSLDLFGNLSGSCQGGAMSEHNTPGVATIRVRSASLERHEVSWNETHVRDPISSRRLSDPPTAASSSEPLTAGTYLVSWVERGRSVLVGAHWPAEKHDSQRSA